ncbi:ABC transporter ATP-binding protein [Kaistella jeonii]|uniref:ABC transporter n=1 Tax=Kaistella jeonii TaxID=266749 RepID=A0A0C1FC74_9FLAO|nr:ABC transporter ATP-binding protein [Kaistella jeonii]KIA90627.1 ABC transporter [Kaistella jeonii]SFB69885.1 iron complex transport system ATP-binding protein [Kaistella jeonii]VEI94776.1 Probable siderophore transport system ATP-binding protein YusV [Kaistella jeonii]
MFLELKNTAIGYKTPLIKGVETSLDLGDICLLIGNNGVGKTTLIKSILHQISTLKGEIILGDKNIKNLSNKQIAEQIAVVFSKAPIPSNFTMIDLISLGKYIHYPYYFELNSADKEEVDEIIENLNLRQYRNFSLNQLSDGNLQKAFIGRALAQNSPMIILDEPTTHLDEENKIIILKLLRKLAKNQNKCILFSSHDWRLSKEFADKMWFIHNEKLEAGITEDILLKHDELLNPQLFHIDKEFIPPHIFAPSLEKEMLYSFLQKNFSKNLSAYKFEWKGTFWLISNHNFQQNCDSFADISRLIKNLH